MATVDAIKTLHTSMIDTRRAYEKAREEAVEPELEGLFGEMAALRERDHEQLHHVLTEMGETPDESGSFMTTVHKAVIAVRSAVKGVDRSSLGAFADGEQTIIEEYDDALKQDDLHARTEEILQRQKAALLEKIARMRALAS